MAMRVSKTTVCNLPLFTMKNAFSNENGICNAEFHTNVFCKSLSSSVIFHLITEDILPAETLCSF